MRDAIALQTRSNPDATAFVDAATDSSWTFRDLDADIEETAGRLAACGVQRGDRVAVLMENRPAFVRLVFACARVGAVLVPLNARLATPELRAQAERVGPALVVCETGTVDAARELPVPAVSVDAKGDVEHVGARSPESFEPADLSWTDTRAIMFTSGTTGNPKAVRLTYASFAASAVASSFRLGVLPEDSWLCPLSLYHMGGLSVVLRSALYGTTAVLTRGFDADDVHEALAEYGCTGVSLVPTMLDRLLDAGAVPASLRFALVGGAPTPPKLVEHALDAGVPVCPTFGMTETTSQVATLHATDARDRPDSSGRPLLGTDITVVGEDGEVLPVGETGELVVSGPTVTPGYLSADANSERFCEHGLRTGDFGFVDGDGFLHVGGRQTDQIVTGGENVHPEEVAAVLRDHPDVANVAVVGVPDDEWGERVAALVVPGDDGVTDAGLREFCEDRLAGYKHPRTIAFAEAVPRTASGTVDREAVRARLADEN
ncbi:o-succinylbenzoate--CoA ligase [Halobacterium sp. KA-4]|uniref:o-succinylbenzoate--CoA ligase n=1 Tax=Halobacterium sp. KA-4 TaxID=2896367 RepID=UPI001E37DCEF|nr:o-succinylbenzoate--CoA ligase [Halobacterium sp. KA-4]MCD2199433.1 o-succinylbenzoate--CoA ligase [Halobacterium sp. KA-4]